MLHGRTRTEVPPFNRGGQSVRDPTHERVVAVQHDASRGSESDLFEQPGRVVDLTEAVELVARDVQQERVPWRSLPHELDCMGLIEFEDGNVRVESAAPIELAKHARDDAQREVA